MQTLLTFNTFLLLGCKTKTGASRSHATRISNGNYQLHSAQ